MAAHTPYYFDAHYYSTVKLAQLAAANAKDKNDEARTSSSLAQAFEAGGMTPQSHYETYGRREGLNPNPYFNEYEYIRAKTAQLNSIGAKDSAGKAYTPENLTALLDSTNLLPVEHYERYGKYETDAKGHLINPSNVFDANAYLSAKLWDVWTSGAEVNGKEGEAVSMADLVAAMKASGMSPVTHYSLYGAEETYLYSFYAQTVPMSQRVPEDPERAVTGDAAPANYSPATPAPKDVVVPSLPPSLRTWVRSFTAPRGTLLS